MFTKRPIPSILPLIAAALWLPCGVLWAGRLAAQQRAAHSIQQPGEEAIARTSATLVHVTGAVDMNHGELLLGNGSTVTAESQPVEIALTRGGKLRLCSTTGLHLAKDRSSSASGAALMMALDRGALQTDYAIGEYSDVLLTPDLRILISGPGQAALSVRVNAQGDTCVDNHGGSAPYVTVTSQFSGGLYRVLPNQRVTFEHGSLNEVVDSEIESCGCPTAPVESVENTGAQSKGPARSGQPAGGPSSTPADTAFPIAVSAGLAPPPQPAPGPVVPAGQTHAEITAPLTYNGEHPAESPPPGMPATRAAAPASNVSPAAPQLSGQHDAPEAGARHRFLYRIGHFFSRIFGA